MPLKACHHLQLVLSNASVLPMETALNHHSSHVISKQVLVPHRPAIFAGSLSEAAMLKDAVAMLLLKTTVNLQEQDLCF